MCPIHKKDNVSNHHPVSLTFILCKIFERILKEDLLYYRNETLAISLHQHVFLPSRSSFSNSIVFEEIVTRMTRWILPRHRFRLAKMKSFGLGDIFAQRIEAYFTGLVSRVLVGGGPSVTIPMRGGVPQSSVISALLFLIFVSDLPDALEAMTLQSCSMPLPHNCARNSPEIVFFLRWAWHL